MGENKNAGLFERLRSIFKKDKKWGNIIFFAGIAGIVLILLSYLFSGGGGKSGTHASSESSTSSQILTTTEEYTQRLEEKLQKIVSSITGSDNVTVMVTLESGAEYIYANDIKASTEETASGQSAATRKDSTEEKYILVDTPEGGQVALLVTELAPTVKGVVVVCDGGNDQKVKEKISNAVTTALDITSKRVCVTGR